MSVNITKTFLEATKNSKQGKKIKTKNEEIADKIMKAIFKKENDGVSKNVKVEINDKDKEKMLQEKLNELTLKYTDPILKKITGSIEANYNYSHVPFYRSDFKGWDKFVSGGYDSASPKQCIEIFVNHLINIKTIPSQIKWDNSSFDNKRPNKGINSLKFFWEDFNESDFDGLRESETESTDTYETTKTDDNNDSDFVELIPDKFISEKSPSLEFLCESFILFNDLLKKTKVKNFRLKSDEIVLRLKLENDTSDNEETSQEMIISKIVDDCSKFFSNESDTTKID